MFLDQGSSSVVVLVMSFPHQAATSPPPGAFATLQPTFGSLVRYYIAKLQYCYITRTASTLVCLYTWILDISGFVLVCIYFLRR